jgi:hypothetical protein
VATPTTDLEIANLALSKLGHTTAIVNLSTDATPEAKAARQWIDVDRDRALGAFAWKFAEKRTMLVPLVGQTHERWTQFYRVPTDWVPGQGRIYTGHPNPNPDAMDEWEAVLTAAGTGRCIACNRPPVGATSPPLALTATAQVGGGTFTAATYFWVVTAISSKGESLASNELSATIALNGTCLLTWTLPTDATSVRVYRGTSAGAESIYFALGKVSTYTDTGAAGTAGTPPTTTAATEPVFFYVRRETNVALYPQHFVDFFASLLAADLAAPLTRKMEVEARAIQKADISFRLAVVAELRGMQPYMQPPTPSVRSRA